MRKARVIPKFTREELVDLYVNQGKSQEEIGAMFDVHQATVGTHLRSHGIETRPVGLPPQVILPEAELRRLYRDEKLTLRRLRAHFGCGTSVIQQNLKRYGMTMDAKEKRALLFERNGKRYSRVTEHRGYVMIRVPDHPSASRSGYVGEHRLVVEAAIGRYLESHEEVHHIDLHTRHNGVPNLAALSKSDHTRVHKYMNRVAAYLCGLTDIRPEALDFGAPVFWGGRYVTSVDLIPPGASRVLGQQALGETTSQETKKEVVN